MRPVAMTGLPIHMYHATHCVSTQLSLDKSVLAYSILECSYGSAVELDMVLSDAPDDDEHLHVRLHSVTLSEGARAIGKALGTLKLAEAGAEVTILRRGKSRLDVKPDTVLNAGDIVVLRGTTDGVARAEERLLK